MTILNIFSKTSFIELMIISLVINFLFVVYGYLKYSKTEKSRYIIDIWLFSFISFYCTSIILHCYLKLTTDSIVLKFIKNINIHFLNVFKMVNSTGITTVFVLLFTGFVSFLIQKVIYKLFSRITTVDKKQRSLIFSRTIILNILIYFSMGQFESVLVLLVILAGKFVWIGTSITDIIDELKILKGSSQEDGDLESLAIFTVMFFMIFFVGAISMAVKLILKH